MPGREDTYHWGFIVGPKNESKASLGQKYHINDCSVKMSNLPALQIFWRYESLGVPMAPASKLLVRVEVAKIVDRERLEAVFDRTPVRTRDPNWNCVEWVGEAYGAALRDGHALGTSVKDWRIIRNKLLSYVDQKRRADRFGKLYNPSQTPTWSLLEGKELLA